MQKLFIISRLKDEGLRTHLGVNQTWDMVMPVHRDNLSPFDYKLHAYASLDNVSKNFPFREHVLVSVKEDTLNDTISDLM